MIVEVIGGAEERPEARVVDIDDLGRLHLALGEVTDEEAAEVLERAGLGRFQDSRDRLLDAAALRAAARAAGDRPGLGRPGGTRWSRRPAARAGCPPTARTCRCTWRAPPEPDFGTASVPAVPTK